MKVWPWLVVLAIAGAPSSARAYRTAAADSDLPTSEPVAWRGPIRVAVGSDLPAGLAAADVTDAIALASAAWVEASCSPLDLSGSASVGASAVQGDGVVTVQPLGARWLGVGYPASVPARTEITFRESAGVWRIADADIYLNDAAFTFALSPSGDELDLVAILTHELGHALGLAHVCAAAGSGEAAPACEGMPDLMAATMYPTYLGPSQREIGTDDAAGLCYLYPAALPTGCDLTGCDPGFLCQAGTCVPDPSFRHCSSEADCEGFERCLGGLCAAGISSVGDPCMSASECGGSVCSTAGRCSQACDEFTPCPSSYECRLGVCTTALGELDEPCTVGEACASNYCLAGARVEPVCTRLCDTSRPCPLGWSCGELEGRVVCIPDARRSGCSAAPTAPGSSRRLGWLMGTLLLLVVRRRS